MITNHITLGARRQAAVPRLVGSHCRQSDFWCTVGVALLIRRRRLKRVAQLPSRLIQIKTERVLEGGPARTRHLGVTKDELVRAIERVGNSAASVRKQLSALNTPSI